MEIKLTSDWIFLHNNVVHCTENSECYLNIYNEFDYYLVMLALESMKNVRFECQELFPANVIHFKNPYYRFYFTNIEDLKDLSPLLYLECQKEVQREHKMKKDIEIKKDLILSYIKSPKTFNQIHIYLDSAYYKDYEEYYEINKDSLIFHTDYLINGLIETGLVKFEKGRYQLV